MQSKINELLSQGIDVSFYQALTQQDIRKYEHQYQIQIPLEYQQFLMHFGEGGFGPSSGLQPLEIAFYYYNDKEPSLTPYTTIQEWQNMIKQGYDYGNGLLLMVADCHVLHGLYCQGEYYGQMVSIDLDHLDYLPQFYASFDEWYRAFLSETLSGYDTQYFGIQFLGNQENVLAHLSDDFDKTLYSLYKFKGLSQISFNQLHEYYTNANQAQQLNLAALFCYQGDEQCENMLHQLFLNIDDCEMYLYWLEIIETYQKDSIMHYKTEIKTLLSLNNIPIILRSLSILSYYLDENLDEILAFKNYQNQDIRECVRTILSQDPQKYKQYLYENIDKQDLRQKLFIKNNRLRYYINNCFSRPSLSPITIEDMQKIKVLDFTKYCPYYSHDFSIIDSIDVLSYASNLTNLNATHYTTIQDFSPLTYCQSLKKLVLANTQLKDISFLLDLQQLKSLDISENPLTDISQLSWLHQLTELIIYNCPIQDWSPLSQLTKLNISVDENQYHELIQLNYAKNWNIHIIKQQTEDFLNFLNLLIDMPNLSNWLKQSVQQRNKYLLEFLSCQDMPMPTIISNKDVNFYFYLNDSEFVQKNPQYFAMEDQAISIDESYEVIGKMGIEKAGLLMKGKKSKKYYLVHDFHHKILSSSDLTDLLSQEYEFYQNNYSHLQEEWIKHYIFYDDFTDGKDEHAFLMRSVYESRIRSLLTSLLDGWSYQDNHDVKSAKIINNIIYFYVNGVEQAQMPMKEFMQMLREKLDLLFDKYFFTMLQKRKYNAAYQQLAKQFQ